jgi:hypothetical protein
VRFTIFREYFPKEINLLGVVQLDLILYDLKTEFLHIIELTFSSSFPQNGVTGYIIHENSIRKSDSIAAKH